MTTTLSVQDALNRLKILRDRMSTAQSILFVSVNIDGQVAGTTPAADYEKHVRSGWQSATALITNYRALKAAIVQSNAVTTIRVGDQEMTVAQAIERKTSIAQLVTLRDQLAQQLQTALNTVERHNTKVSAEAEKSAEASFGKRTDGATPLEEYESFVRSYVQRRSARLADPLGARDLLTQMTEEIDNFKSNVDSALTTSNVMTMITVDLVN